jgi:Rieske Fe-S protein
VAQYADWVKSGERDSFDEVQAGQGAVIRKGATKQAVYRDEEGELHVCSAVCPHLSGIVRWNPNENTWDCPCHGSRFDRFAAVVNGPAIKGLKPCEVEVRATAA